MNKEEDLLLDLAIQKGNMDQPITAAKGLIFVNYLTKGAEIEGRLKDNYYELQYFHEDKYYVNKWR